MPAAIKVVPKAWTEISVLYDDGMYSVIWGRFRGNNIKSLGVRWNGKDDKGYPNLGKNPLWYREPEFLIIPILNGLLEKYQGIMKTTEVAHYIEEIQHALEEAKSQGTSIHGAAVFM